MRTKLSLLSKIKVLLITLVVCVLNLLANLVIMFVATAATVVWAPYKMVKQTIQESRKIYHKTRQKEICRVCGLCSGKRKLSEEEMMMMALSQMFGISEEDLAKMK